MKIVILFIILFVGYYSNAQTFIALDETKEEITKYFRLSFPDYHEETNSLKYLKFVLNKTVTSFDELNPIIIEFSFNELDKSDSITLYQLNNSYLPFIENLSNANYIQTSLYIWKGKKTVIEISFDTENKGYFTSTYYLKPDKRK